MLFPHALTHFHLTMMSSEVTDSKAIVGSKGKWASIMYVRQAAEMKLMVVTKTEQQKEADFEFA